MRLNLRMWSAMFLCLGLLGGVARQASAVPMWSRKYGVPCSACHAMPSLQLTSMGLNFFRRGHRMEDDGAEKNFANLLSAHGEWNYALQQHAAAPFPDPEMHLHAGGPLSNVISTYADANLNADFEVLYVQATTVDGPDAFFTARAGGATPVIIREYANGLMSSSSTPLIITDATIGMNPYTPGRANAGVDIAQQWKAVFIQAGVVNGQDVAGQAAIGSHKDAFVSAQISMSDEPTGIGVYYFNGGYDLVADTAGTTQFDRYDRGAVFANLTKEKFRLAGAFLAGREQIGSSTPLPTMSGCYLQADLHPKGRMRPFARYDWVKTENIAGAGTINKGTLGVATAIYLTDVTGGRLTLELSREDDAGTKVNGGAVGLLWAF